MKNALTRFRSGLIVITAVTLAACADDKVSAPQSPTGLAPQANSVTPPGLQLSKRGPLGSTATFLITANGGSMPLGSTVTLDACPLDAGIVCTAVLVWTPTNNDLIDVTVTEIATTGGIVFEEIAASRTMDGVTTFHGVFAPAAPTLTLAMNGNATALVRFKNVDAPNKPPLRVEKTAAGSFKIPVRWELVKSVNPTSHTGTAGTIAGSSIWSVTATRVEGAPTDHMVTGTITVSNPADGVSQIFSVSDVMNGVAATVNCPTFTLIAGQSTTCTYSAAVAGATLNTATVSSVGFPDVTATAPVTYTSSFTGDQSVTLADPRFSYSQAISSTTTVTFPESFPCPSDAAQYVNGTHNRTETNTATLTGANTNLTRMAQVNITCTRQVEGETATGQGFPWSATQGAPSNWFMYTPWVTTGGHRGISAAASGSTPSGTNLIAGQHHIAGRITGTRGTTTSITITLNSAWDFLGVAGDVKVNPMSCTTGQPYVSPGKFTVHRSSPDASSITITGLPNTACYGIHVDVVGN
jgi:hypothetical protein